MPVTHTNRMDQVYYLHAGTTKTGKPRYWFSMKTDGECADAIPDGYEIHEKPDGQVFLRKIVPQLITPFELALVRRELERYAPGEHCIVEVEKEHIVIHHAQKLTFDMSEFGLGPGLFALPAGHGNYMKAMRFTLMNQTSRTFFAQRWCSRGSIDDWINLFLSGGHGSLSDLVKRYGPHLGKESFFELM